MEDFGEYMARKEGWVLRSGGAEGADQAFEFGHDRVHKDFKQIFYANDCTPEAMAIARQFHPVWYKLKEFPRKLHGHNAMQILGPDVNNPVKSQFMVCWTPDRCLSHKWRTIRTGGTGTAISIADYYGVRIYNLAHTDHLEYVKSKIYS